MFQFCTIFIYLYFPFLDREKITERGFYVVSIMISYLYRILLPEISLIALQSYNFHWREKCKEEERRNDSS